MVSGVPSNQKRNDMSLIGYMKTAQEKLFKPTQVFSASLVTPYAETQAPAETLRSPPDFETPNAAAGETIEKFINAQNHAVEGLSVKYDAATKTIVIRGTAFDRASRERIVLSCRSVIGVAKIEDRLTIATPQSLESNYRINRPGIAPSTIAMTESRTANTSMKPGMNALAAS